jgi:chaperone BCS1
MNQSREQHSRPGNEIMDSSELPRASGINPQAALLDTFFPGFTLASSAVQKYAGIDVSIYFPAFVMLGLVIWASRYVSQWFWESMDQYLMSSADIRIDDEMYNMVMAWVAKQQFAKNSRRFVANTNLNSRMWWLFRDSGDDAEDEDEEDEGNRSLMSSLRGKKRKLQFTPSFGTHYFWYKGRPFIFSRTQDRNQNAWGTVSERENVSLSSFGRDTSLLKDLLDECRAAFQKEDEKKTIIYRGGLKKGTAEPDWTRCSARPSRAFSTVVLDESVKQGLLDDMADYLHPRTRRWYSNRGIPYRRGYLMTGPPGTGKSSLSFAIAGYFRLKIYIVSLNSPAMNEENLGNLFADLPKKCLVLLEDIDTAGLTHTRGDMPTEEPAPLEKLPGSETTTTTTDSSSKNSSGRISLSALLNILDGVASQEGRVLVMTTNHIEKLDEALIRPGRVDMVIKFGLATTDMIITIFRTIFATIEGDLPKSAKPNSVVIRPSKQTLPEPKIAEDKQAEIDERERQEAEVMRLAEEARVFQLGQQFAELIPALTFSPAEIQGYLLKNKREPEMAVKNAAEWVRTTLLTKKKKAQEEKEKALKDEEAEKEKAEKEKAEKEKAEKEKAEKEKAEKEKAEKEKAEKEKAEESKPAEEKAETEPEKELEKVKSEKATAVS